MVEGLGFFIGVVFRAWADVAPADVLDEDVLEGKFDVVTRVALLEGLVVHPDELDLGGDGGGGKSDDHTSFYDHDFDLADWHCSDSADFVDVLEREPSLLVYWPAFSAVRHTPTLTIPSQ